MSTAQSKQVQQVQQLTIDLYDSLLRVTQERCTCCTEPRVKSDLRLGRRSLSARYVRRLIAERRIVFYRLGRSVRIDPADLTAFVTAGRVQPITETTVWKDLRGVA